MLTVHCTVQEDEALTVLCTEGPGWPVVPDQQGSGGGQEGPVGQAGERSQRTQGAQAGDREPQE